MMHRAVLHVHSTFSDGEFTLAEVREVFLKTGCRVVCVTDHADAFGRGQLEEYRAECARLTDGRMLLLPGLEYSCQRRMHIVGFGTVAPIASDDPEVVLRHIRDSGGVSMIAHPHDDAFDWIESFAELPDGVEAWNTKYDGRYAPRPATFALIQRLRVRHPDLRAFYGQDLHWRRQARTLFVELDVREAPTAADVLLCLREGRFRGRWRDVLLPSDGVVEATQLEHFARRLRKSQLLRRALRRLRTLAGPIGRNLPPAVKSQLRRLF